MACKVMPDASGANGFTRVGTGRKGERVQANWPDSFPLASSDVRFEFLKYSAIDSFDETFADVLI